MSRWWFLAIVIFAKFNIYGLFRLRFFENLSRIKLQPIAMQWIFHNYCFTLKRACLVVCLVIWAHPCFSDGVRFNFALSLTPTFQVSIWSAPDMQEKFKKATRKWPLWEEMGKMLERAGFYGRDAKQCEALMHRWVPLPPHFPVICLLLPAACTGLLSPFVRLFGSFWPGSLRRLFYPGLGFLHYQEIVFYCRELYMKLGIYSAYLQLNWNY